MDVPVDGGGCGRKEWKEGFGCGVVEGLKEAMYVYVGGVEAYVHGGRVVVVDE